MNTQLMPVPFHDDTVVLVDQDNEPFVAMKPIVANMGMDWPTQYVKLTEKFGSTIGEIPTVAEDGKLRPMTCLPLRKLAAWLYSISPNKVAPELRDKIIQYQEECDEVLWKYWTTGAAVRPGAISIPQQISMSKHRIALLKELMRTRNRAMRELLGQEILKLSGAMGMPAPDLDAIGIAEPTRPDILADFWAAVLHLDDKGIAYNHSISSGLIALNIPHLTELFSTHGLQIGVGPDVLGALKICSRPEFLQVKPVSSALKGRSVKCWVFRKPPQVGL
ncbi:phage antirepressor N-terminal domain-containing protein [Pseudomonas sp. UBA4194]|uniref:phage antirepressor N-terminal domain-containing protein n=1 Tax=Pseudomonas sp. UBA4194 TaxID=1947317 RepID=UPI0025E02548|nr:phage antirepressor N-terminal domain-containing protein [Pseudomonas sp. UBA4194]